MAIDLSLLDRSERSGDTWLRLYRWHPSCLSFGRHEPAMRRYDVEQISRLGLDTVRRPTGGRAVWHARELTYALTGPIAQFNSPHAAYLEIHTVCGRPSAGSECTDTWHTPAQRRGSRRGPVFLSRSAVRSSS